MKNKFIILLGLISILLPLTIFADVLPENEKMVHDCYKISNLDSYPDYLFLIHPIYPAGKDYEIIKSDDCLSWYKHVQPHIYAIKREDFSEVELGIDTDYEVRRDYFNHNPKVALLFNLRSYGTVPINNPLDKLTTILTISSIDESNLVIKESKIIYYYVDGTTKEAVLDQSESTPSISVQPSAPKPWRQNNLYYLLIAGGALIIIVIILLIKKLKK